eukprot:130996-Rhodomonas_salina.6
MGLRQEGWRSIGEGAPPCGRGVSSYALPLLCPVLTYARLLRAPSAMSGTHMHHATTRVLCHVRYYDAPASYAVPIRCPVLTSAMLLLGSGWALTPFRSAPLSAYARAMRYPTAKVRRRTEDRLAQPTRVRGEIKCKKPQTPYNLYRRPVVSHLIVSCLSCYASYAMPRTVRENSTGVLRICYAVSGTDAAYPGTRSKALAMTVLWATILRMPISGP